LVFPLVRAVRQPEQERRLGHTAKEATN